MIVGGIWSIFSIRHSIIKGFKSTRINRSRIELPPSEQDLSLHSLGIGLLVVAIPLFIFYWYLTHSISIALVAGIAMLITAFFFVAVSSYIVGVVGSSNNPVSGMTIVTLLFASILLLLFKLSGITGILAALGVAGVVCCAACTAGDISQDLKTGYLVGSSPRYQEITQLISVVVSAVIIAPVLIVLHTAYGIGTGQPGSLSAPQASLFASITTAMFTDKVLPWNMIIIGAIIGVLLIVTDEILKAHTKFRTYIMPTAVGIYLPFVLSVPILLGGIVNHIVKKATRNSDSAINNGILFSSGLIAGESIMGIIIAFMIVGHLKLPITIIKSNFISLIAFAIVVGILTFVSLKPNTTPKTSE
ncbi:MAG: oligopeptide transporter, OPT family [Candidatus Stahlbacteria bacterium]|nr:oligopeptide transporter, OPT family [Candidatus Stahlbacteria bacterium]